MRRKSSLLKDARALIAQRSNWCQGKWHRRVKGHDQYCALGALRAVGAPELAEKLHEAAEDLYGASVLGVNDGLTTVPYDGERVTAREMSRLDHERVLRCYDLAIERSKRP